MKILRFGLGCISAGLIAVACGGSTDGEQAVGPVSANDVDELFVDAVCQIRDCCDVLGFDYDEAGCKEHARPGVSEFFTPGVHQRYDAEAAGKCVNAMRAWASSCESYPEDITQCFRVVVGTQPVGGTCSSSEECADGADGHGTCVGGACEVQGHRKVGEACGGTCVETPGLVSCTFSSDQNRECYVNDGVYCAPSGRCAPVDRLGEACSEHSCELGTHCNGIQCVVDLAEGSACDYSEDCKAGLYCSDQTRECTAPSAVGEACGQWDACDRDGSCDNGVCVRDAAPKAVECSGVEASGAHEG